MIIGQETINKEITRIFDIFRSSNGTIRPHFILTGPSGSGKTYITKELCASKEMPYVEVNAAQITKEGMSGNILKRRFVMSRLFYFQIYFTLFQINLHFPLVLYVQCMYI